MKNLRDIDMKDIDRKGVDIGTSKANQGQDVVEALSRVLRNENDVCTVFEKVMSQSDPWAQSSVSFDLYDASQSPWNMQSEVSDVVTFWAFWAKKMSFHGEVDLTDAAKMWVEATIKEPRKRLQNLGRGHLKSLTRKRAVKGAKIPYRLAYRALHLVSRPETSSKGFLLSLDSRQITFIIKSRTTCMQRSLTPT